MPRLANLLMTAAIGLGASAPVLAQAAASVGATGGVRIMQPAMISTSQDLMFAVTAPAVASLTTISAPRVTPTGSTTGGNGSASTGSDRNGGSRLRSTSSLSARVPAPAQATFLVTGDAGQSISVTVPSSIDLTREGGVETALLTTSDSLDDGPQFLGGDFASAGALSFNVGGQVTLAENNVAAGTYNGVLAVVAQYN